MTVRRETVREMIENLLHEIEEEDVGISLFSTFYQDESDLHFFKKEDRAQVIRILKRLSEDSKQHKTILEKIITLLAGRSHDKSLLSGYKLSNINWFGDSIF